jgi:hypothetical protein
VKERRFYTPAEFETTMVKMEKILRREGLSMSKWIRRKISDHVRIHENGNNQQYLDWFQDHDYPYIAPEKCFFVDCDREASFLGEYKGERHYVCGWHRKRVEHSKSWGGWKEI